MRGSRYLWPQSGGMVGRSRKEYSREIAAAMGGVLPGKTVSLDRYFPSPGLLGLGPQG